MKSWNRIFAFCLVAALSIGLCQAESTNQISVDKPDIVDRDPFVNQILAGEEHPPGFTYPDSSRSRVPGKLIVCAYPDDYDEDEDYESCELYSPPPVTVTGIVGGQNGRMAILKGDSTTRIVKVGDTLGQYRVSRIESKLLIFTAGDKDFDYPLEAEFD